MNLTLPLPPSVNSYWRSVSVKPGVTKVLISRDGRAWKKKALQLVAMQRTQVVTGPVSITLTVYFKDLRRDLDNTAKPVLDLLQAAGLYANDRQVTRLLMVRRVDKGNPRVEVQVEQDAQAKAA